MAIASDAKSSFCNLKLNILLKSDTISALSLRFEEYIIRTIVGYADKNSDAIIKTISGFIRNGTSKITDMPVADLLGEEVINKLKDGASSKISTLLNENKKFLFDVIEKELSSSPKTKNLSSLIGEKNIFEMDVENLFYLIGLNIRFTHP